MFEYFHKSSTCCQSTFDVSASVQDHLARYQFANKPDFPGSSAIRHRRFEWWMNEGTNASMILRVPLAVSRARHDETSNAFHEVVRRRSAFAEKDEEAEEASKTN